MKITTLHQICGGNKVGRCLPTEHMSSVQSETQQGRRHRSSGVGVAFLRASGCYEAGVAY